MHGSLWVESLYGLHHRPTLIFWEKFECEHVCWRKCPFLVEYIKKIKPLDYVIPLSYDSIEKHPKLCIFTCVTIILRLLSLYNYFKKLYIFNILLEITLKLNDSTWKSTRSTWHSSKSIYDLSFMDVDKSLVSSSNSCLWWDIDLDVHPLEKVEGSL